MAEKNILYSRVDMLVLSLLLLSKVIFVIQKSLNPGV